MKRNTALLLTVVIAVQMVLGQNAIDPDLLAEINRTPAIDNHSHVEAMVGDGGIDDDGDAIPCGGLSFVSPPPMRLRVDNAIYTGAWLELFGFRADAINENTSRDYLIIKNKIRADKSDQYPTWILDKLNIDVMLANRKSMGRGLKAPRFRWVAYGDPLLLPFSTKIAFHANPDVSYFLARQETLRARIFTENKIQDLPVDLDSYLKTVVIPSLKSDRAKGAVAVKFVSAYYRSLDFSNVTKSAASRIYARFARGGAPSASEYKVFQDYVFRIVASEAARIGLAVHIHTGGGCGHFFNLSSANPLLLEPFLNSPERNAAVVLVHGGFPFVNETAFLLEKPNVFADFSAQTFLLSPNSLSLVIRTWLEYEPEKILFGTDASPATPDVGWEETAWLTNRTAREALARALSAMIRDGEITRQRASELQRMVLRQNAANLYGFESKK